MSKTRLNFTALIAVLLMAIAQSMGTSRATNSARLAGAFDDPDLKNEARTLDTYVDDWIKFHRKVGESNKLGSLSPSEFDSLERNADDLKSRLSGVQDALRKIITKLKAAGEWNDNLDARVLAGISEPKIQARFRQNSFRRTLEDAASQLTDDSNEISEPLRVLRGKVSGPVQGPSFERDSSGLSMQVLLVAYHPGPTMQRLTLMCRLSYVRLGISGFIHKGPTQAAINANFCACDPGLCV